ncbi:hypothetical protein P167DRAFT_549910 [Morchella conica CCBAS932]|uniref:Uncharacterized protein n=1 Tax=Morchella conica CCBAS932 TaxID=1392247 RepID=A0A3N4KFZ3_9PEZI|nr:hypothetical protein P167DRAFT_549910 [Morchella conica CCBAS932]
MNSYEHYIDGGLQYTQRATENRRILEDNPDFVEAVHNGQHTFYNIRTGGFFADPTVEHNEGHRSLAFASGSYSSLGSAETQPFPSTHHRGVSSIPEYSSSGSDPSTESWGASHASREYRNKPLNTPNRAWKRTPSPLRQGINAEIMPADLAAEILECVDLYEPATLMAVGLTLEHIEEARRVHYGLRRELDAEDQERAEELYEQVAESAQILTSPYTGSVSNLSYYKSEPEHGMIRRYSSFRRPMERVSRFCSRMLNKSKMIPVVMAVGGEARCEMCSCRIGFRL